MLALDQARFRYGPQNRFRPPDWRYRLAKACVAADKLPSFRRDDKTTFRIGRFLRALELVHKPKQRLELPAYFHDLWTAFQLHHGKLKHLRALVESYLLARMDAASIAARLGLSPEVIDWYRLTFFDVEDRLQYRQYVLFQVIGITDEEGQATLDTHRLWKLIGYSCGAQALDELLYGTNGDATASQAKDLAGWCSRQMQSVLRGKQLLAVSALRPDNEKHQTMLLRMLAQSNHQELPADDTPRNELEQHIYAMLQDLPWATGPEHIPEPLREWQDAAVDLRADEEMLLAAGEKLPELDELKHMTFPLPGAKTPADKPKNTSAN
jgi:hypothetical protein